MLAGAGVLLLAHVAGCRVPAVEAERAVIKVNPAVTHQTITGWEATAQAGQLDAAQGGPSAAFLKYKDRLFDLAVNDLGINRLRVEVKSGAENPRDYFAEFLNRRISRAEWKRHWYEKVNDNADPNVIDQDGFHFSEVDHTIDHLVIPMQQRLKARGEHLFVVLNYVDFGRSRFEHYEDPEEYAEFMLAAFQHLHGRYGRVPDAIEVVLEPDNTPWNGKRLGRAVAATGRRLRAHGFSPCFIAPSTTDMTKAVFYFDDMVGVPGVLGALRELSYHRYRGVSDPALRDIARRAARHGLDTAMLEHIGSGYEDLHNDLTLGRASAWQQFTLAYPNEDDGGQYYWIDQRDPNDPKVHLGHRTRFLRQYFKYIRAGATRVDATSTSKRVGPVAFVNRDGGHVVVVKATASGPLVIEGLPAGTYGVSYATENDTGVDGGDVTIGSGEPLQAAIPHSGVITICGKTGRVPAVSIERRECP